MTNPDSGREVTAKPEEDSKSLARRSYPGSSIVVHLRPISVLLLLSIVVTCIAYPAVITGIAQGLTPNTANGSLLKSSNGTVVGSALLAENLTKAPWLFWPRPSLTDYSYFLGEPTPNYTVDPGLVNVTLAYMAAYGPYAVNASVPFSLVSVSGSSFDPDITPEAALVQIPRIAMHTNLTQAALMSFVLEHLVEPAGGFVGPTYLNVLELDIALLPLEGR